MNGNDGECGEAMRRCATHAVVAYPVSDHCSGISCTCRGSLNVRIGRYTGQLADPGYK
jgi:hypothetical protein